jgi:hypothetical protein
MPILAIFFEEMWPTLRSASERLRAFTESGAHSIGTELPGKTFTATPGFFELQLDGGALTHAFEIGGIESRRMVVPYQIWMWQRICTAMAETRSDPQASRSIDRFLSSFRGGANFFDIEDALGSLRVRKEGALLYSESA